jgi:hypothetical protein
MLFSLYIPPLYYYRFSLPLSLLLKIMTESNNKQPLVADVLLPEIEKQLIQDDSLWPNIKGLYIIHVTKKKQPVAIWYFEV